MGNSLRCCLACMLPCGALDVVRVVHLSGRVEEYSRQVSAGEILASHPNHVLSKPCPQGVVRQITIVSDNSDLKRGHIYFLIPTSSLRGKKKKRKEKTTMTKSEKQDHQLTNSCTNSSSTALKAKIQDSYLAEILSEKKPSHRGRRIVRVGVWRPHLESITEDP